MSSVVPIKLAFVTTVPQTLGFFGEHIDFLKQRGFEIHLVSSPGKKGTRLAEEKSVIFHPVPMTRSITLAADVYSLLALRRTFKKIRPAIVHSLTPKAGLLGTIAARLARVPIVFLSLFGLPQMTERGRRLMLLDTMTRTSCLLAHHIWIDSPSMREYVVKKRLCPEAKAVTIGNGSVNGVDAKRVFSPKKRRNGDREKIRKQLGIPREDLVLGYVGRIVRDKGMHELAMAWKELRELYSGLRLLIVGEEEDRDPISNEDRTLFLSDLRIHIAGFTTNVASYMAAMDIYVMPSYREGFGLTNIEASAMELPVISTQIPGCMDSVQDGVTGILVPVRDSQKLKEAIRIYLENPELCAVHGIAGRQRVLRDFRPEIIWQGLYKEYRRFLEARGKIS